MTLLHFDGFEGVRKAPMSTAGITYVTGRAGGQCAQLASNGIWNWNLPVTVADTMYVGFGYKFQGPANACQMLTVVSTQGAEFQIRPLAEHQVSSNFSWYGPQGGGPIGTTFQIPHGIWSYVEIMTRIATTGGRLKIKVDGATVLDFTGNTRYWTPSGGPFGITAITGYSQYSEAWYDDLYVCDNIDATATQGRPFNDFLGPIRVEQLLPNANGVSSQFTGSDGNSTDNYLLVDEAGTPASADYVSSTTTGHRDLYEFTNTALTVGTIYGVEVVATAQDSTGSGTLTKTIARSSSGTVSAGGGRSTPVAWAGTGDGPRTKDPEGALWTIASLNGAQYGIEVG